MPRQQIRARQPSDNEETTSNKRQNTSEQFTGIQTNFAQIKKSRKIIDGWKTFARRYTTVV